MVGYVFRMFYMWLSYGAIINVRIHKKIWTDKIWT